MNRFYVGLSFVLCLILTPVVRRIATHRGWLAIPSKERWHDKPTSLMGGIAIYSSMAIPLFFICDFSTLLPHITDTSGSAGLPSIGAVIWIGMTLLFLVGLLDDFIHVKPQTKLVGQILVASMVAFLGFRLHWFESLTIDTLITIFWVVGISNAFNLLDNMDGLCAGIGAIAALYFSFLFAGMMPEAFLISLILAAALVGFLFYNFNPASIFMGDCGSLFIGFMLAVLGLFYTEVAATHAISIYAVPVLLLMVPILDTSMVTLIRILSGRKASVGGKDHTSHRLVLMGLSERGAVLFLYGIGAVSGLSALFVSMNDPLSSPAVIIPVVVSILLMATYLSQLRVYPEKEFSLLRDRSYTPVLIEITYKRQLILVLLDFFIIAFSYYLSYRLRFDSQAFFFYFQIFLRSLPAVIACKFIAFFTIGIYRGIWGYMSINDVYVHIKASTAATFLSVVAVTFIYRFEDFSKGIFIIDWLLTTGFLIGTRGSFRLAGDIMKRKTLSGDDVIIYGAGRGGEILLRELLNNKRHRVKPVGFIDDDPLKKGKKLQGYPVFGPFEDLASLKDRYDIRGLIISFSDNDSIKHNAIKRFCLTHGLYAKRFSIDLEDLDLED